MNVDLVDIKVYFPHHRTMPPSYRPLYCVHVQHHRTYTTTEGIEGIEGLAQMGVAYADLDGVFYRVFNSDFDRVLGLSLRLWFPHLNFRRYTYHVHKSPTHLYWEGTEYDRRLRN